MNTGKKKSLTCSQSKRFCLCYFCFAGAMKKNIIRAFKLGCLWFNSNSIGCTLFLPKIPTASDLVKQKCGIMGGSPGTVAHLQAAVCYCQNKGKSKLH